MLSSFWIQRADFSSSEHQAARAEEAVRAYETHDWESELALEAELRSAESEHCQPGIGFVAEPGHILHICPGGESALVHYHYPEQSKILGLIPVSRSRVLSLPSLPLADVSSLIQLFVSGQGSALRATLERAAA